jgi:large subunit ribosomal protein L3
VTVVQAGPCVVVKKKLGATKDGYSALVLGFGDAEPQPSDKDRLVKPSRRWLDRPMTRFYDKTFPEGKARYFEVLREVRLPEQQVDSFDIGDEIKADIFTPGDFVDVVGTSKGRGFSGVMKRHHFKGMTQSHGTHEYFRHGGAVSSNTYPGRLFSGRRMPGQLGNARVTVQNIRVLGTDPEKNLIYLRGAIPGPEDGLVFVRRAKKKKKQ